MIWKEYYELEPIRRLRYEGRELLGKLLIITEKRDGENVSLHLDEEGNLKVSSHNMEVAAEDIVNRMMAVPEYEKAKEILQSELEFGNHWVLYGELLKTRGPTRVEPKRKYLHWILFDIWDCEAGRYLGYNRVYQVAYQYKIPVVRIVERLVPSTLEELNEMKERCLKWCRHHRREGIVGKDYKNQVFFKERIDLPKLPKIKKPQGVQLPSMPDERIMRALQHAFDEVGEENWKTTKIAMPIVAKHMAIEAKEHYFSTPRNIYHIWLNTEMEDIKASRETKE